MKRTLKDRINQRLGELGMTPTEASRQAGMSDDWLRKLLNSEKGGANTHNIIRLAPVLDRSVQWLLGDDDAPQSAPRRREPTVAQGFAPVSAISVDAMRASMPLDLPVLGTAAGSLAREGGFEIESRVIEYVRRPPALAGVPEAYAILVTGNSMAPEHKDGDLRFVHPHRRPVVGEGVIIQAQYDSSGVVEAYLGNYEKRTATKLQVTKLNPVCTVEFELSYVRSVHKVLTLNELFGL